MTPGASRGHFTVPSRADEEIEASFPVNASVSLPFFTSPVCRNQGLESPQGSSAG